MCQVLTKVEYRHDSTNYTSMLAFPMNSLQATQFPCARTIDLRRELHVAQIVAADNNRNDGNLKDDPLIYTVGGSQLEDYQPLLDAARKAVEHGYRVFVLPNPKGFRTADFIFERKGVYKMFDLKTIVGRNSVGNRLKESIGQAPINNKTALKVRL